MNRILLMIMTAAALSPAAFAQKTLDDCVSTALANHPSYAASRATVDAARAGVGVSRAAWFPSITLGAGVRRFQTRAFLPSGVPVASPVIGPVNDVSAGIDAGFTLYDHGRRRADLAAARSLEQSSGESSAASRDTIIYGVHEAYYRLGASLESVRAARARLDRAEEHVRLAQIRAASGAVPPVDVLRARTAAASAKLGLIEAAAAADIARGALNTAMGLPPESALEIAPPASGPRAPTIDLAAVTADAVTSRPDVVAARRRESMQAALVSSARAAYGPSARVYAGYGARDTAFFPNGRDWYAGVSVDLSIFDGWATRQRVARAAAEEKREELTTGALLLSVRQEIWSAHANLARRGEAVAAADAARNEATEAVRLAGARYDAGAGTINDLLDAEAALLQAETDAIRAEADERLAWSAFRKAAGTLSSAQ